MALLIVEHDGKIEAGVIHGRVVIGRRPQEQIRVADSRVSRIHAWIDCSEDGTHYIIDAGSRTGTFVNGERIALRREIDFGDQIHIGPLRLQLAHDETIPDGATPIDLRQRKVPQPSPTTGISFDCNCGAPIWAPWAAAGKFGQCRVCNVLVAVPRQASRPQATAREPTPAVVERLCGICHGSIQPVEETTRCPSCGALFHIECWTENGGCSVYGCSAVAAIGTAESTDEPTEEIPAETENEDENSEDVISPEPDSEFLEPASSGTPVAYALLAMSVLCTVAGALTFGVTAILSAAGALIYLMWRKPKQHRGIIFLSIAVSLVGAVVGIGVSYYWWLGGKR